MDNFKSMEFGSIYENFRVNAGRITEIHNQGKIIKREEIDSSEEFNRIILNIMGKLDVVTFLCVSSYFLYNDSISSKLADLVYEERVRSGEIDSERHPLSILRELTRTYREYKYTHDKSDNIFALTYYTYNCMNKGYIRVDEGFVVELSSNSSYIARSNIDFYYNLYSSMNDMAKFNPEEFMRMYHSLTNDPIVKQIAEKIRVERREAYNKNPFDL